MDVDHLRKNSTLCLDIEHPAWDNARGYAFDPATSTMYFPVSKRFLAGRDLDSYDVLIWSEPRLIVTGRLADAATESDYATQRRLLLSQGWDADKADYALLDQRTRKPRKNRFKLAITSIREADTSEILRVD